MKDNDVVSYLNSLYSSDFQVPENNTTCVEPTISQKKFVKKFVQSNIENYIFRQKHAGPYCRKLEKEVSLTHDEINSIVSNKKGTRKMNLDNFSEIFFTWEKYNNLSDDLHKRFNRAVLLKLYKNGDDKNPKNYRYLYNFSNNVKLLDKIWSHRLCKELIGKIDGNKYLSYHVRGEFNKSMKFKAVEFTDCIDNKIMLDFEKAFDNVSFFSIQQLLKDFLVRKLGIKKGTIFFEQYFNLIINTQVYYNGIKIKRIKGIPTGLSSSNLIFTAIIDQIFYIYLKMYPTFLKYFNYNVYVDDIAIDILDNSIDIKKFIDPLLNIFKYYKFKCNPKKCLISNNISNNYENFGVIQQNTKYLGIYFCREISQYFDIIIKEFNEKKKTDCKNIASMIKYNRKAARGFLKYKLAPFLKKN